jgi:hypothetical protein
MRPRNIFAAIVSATALVLIACGGHRAKFELRDHVIRKLTGEKAIVAARMRPFAHDIYWLRMPGGLSDHEFSPRGANWHLDGPFYEDDLVLSHD